MKIGVNTRMAGYSRSGIPMVINNLYARLPTIDKSNKYLLFGPSKPLSPLRSIIFDNFSILRFVIKNKIGLFHGPAHTLPWIKFYNIKYLLTVHDLSFLIVPQMGSFSFKLFYGLWIKRSIHLADHIVTDSENTKLDLMKLFNVNPVKITSIYLGVDRSFKPGKFNSKNRYIMTVATHPKRKNLQALLRVFVQISSKYDLDLKIVGEVLPEHWQILTSAGLDNRVQHFKHIPQAELISLYQNALVFVYPSLYEGFGLPVLEAMACGVPALCSDNSSLPEIQTDPNQRFETSNAEDLAKKLKKILDLTVPERTQLCKRNAISARKFTWDKTAIEYMRVIHALGTST